MSAKTWALALALATGGALTPTAQASDHADMSAKMTTDLGTLYGPRDIADLYSWVDNDPTSPNTPRRVFMILTVYPNAPKATAMFDTGTLYSFHTVSKAKMADSSATANSLDIVCAFTQASALTSQIFECWGGDDEYVKGFASSTTTKGSVQSPTGKIKAWAGVVNDPAFFNKADLTTAISTIKTSLGNNSWTRDAAQCATTGSAWGTAQALAMRNGLSATKVDAYNKQNVLAIVLSVDPQYLTQRGNSPLLGVWASTKKRIPK